MVRNNNNSNFLFKSSPFGTPLILPKGLARFQEKGTKKLTRKFFISAKRRIKSLVLKVDITNRFGPGAEGKDIPIPLFEKLIKETKKYGFRSVFFVGGESIFHPEFEKLIKLVSDYQYRFNIRINNPFLYQKYWRIIRKYKNFCAGVNLNLNGATSEIHDIIQNKKGSFEKLIEAVKFYAKNNIAITISAFLNQKNKNQIGEIDFLCKSLEIKILRYTTALSFLSPETVLSNKEKKDCVKIIKKINQTKAAPLKMFIGSELLVNNPSSIDFCRDLTPFRRLNINYDGGMLFCRNIYKRCKNRPSILKEEILKCLEKNIDIVGEIKKQRLKDINQKTYFEGFNTCEYCNRYIEKILKNQEDEN